MSQVCPSPRTVALLSLLEPSTLWSTRFLTGVPSFACAVRGLGLVLGSLRAFDYLGRCVAGGDWAVDLRVVERPC
eukprot:5796793-Lingulodinium_polyedra.AAC.1